LAVILAAVSLMACNNDRKSTNNDANNLLVRLSGVHDTRFSAPGDIVTDQTQELDGVMILLTDASDNVSEIVGVSKTTEPDRWTQLTNTAEGGGIKIINVEKSTSKVYVFGNPTLSNLYATGSVTELATNLPAQSNGGEVLYRGVDADLSPVVPEPFDPEQTEGQTYTAEVAIKPIVARMQIKSVTFQPTGTVTITKTIDGTPRSTDVTWSAFTGTLKGVYLNNFYYDYTFADNATTLMHNTFYDGTIQDGQWLFNGTDAASYASYVSYASGAYADLPLDPSATNQCYGFNFFPGAEIPTLHLDLDADITFTNPENIDMEVFNPYLTNMRFANIVKYYKDGNEMTAADFVAGHIYNMDVELKPILDVDISTVQYNVLVTVTVEPWVEETITPGFDYEN
jgi:hypothetical protein